MSYDWQWFFDLFKEKIVPLLENRGYSMINWEAFREDSLDNEEPDWDSAYIMYESQKGNLFVCDNLKKQEFIERTLTDIFWLRINVFLDGHEHSLASDQVIETGFGILPPGGWVCFDENDVSYALDEIAQWINMNM